MPDQPSNPDATLGERSPAGWRRFVAQLWATGKAELAKSAAALAVGFGLAVGALLVFADLAEDVAKGVYRDPVFSITEHFVRAIGLHKDGRYLANSLTQ